jgi:O-methyltransferase involved in polyketide biosynthesis
VRAYSGPGSIFAFTWFERWLVDRPRPSLRMVARLVARRGEPWRFGWDPAELPAWLAARGWELERDRNEVELAEALYPPHLARRVDASGRHVSTAKLDSRSSLR